MRRQIAAAAAFALALGIGAAPPLPAAQAQDAFALFDDFLQKPAARIEFRQLSYDSSGTLLEENNGTLSYLRPGKFRLQYENPSHPLIVSNGEEVWLYEKDIEQVVIARTADVQKHGLWQVLALGGTESLKERYVLSAGVSGELRWLTATARADSAANLQEVALGFAADGGALQQVRIVDNLGGAADLFIRGMTFSADGEEFEFDVPEGSAVILHGEQ